jgi:integrase
MTTATRITKRTVDALQPGDLVWDTDVKGFGVRCQARAKVYILKARVDGRQRWFVIGDHGAPWTPETARYEAQKRWGDIRAGVNLVAIREARREQPTMAELCERFLVEHARQHKKPQSVAADERNITNHVLPVLGTRTVKDITRDDIEDLKRKVKEGKTAGTGKRRRGGRLAQGGPGAANRCLALLSKMFNLAEEWRWRPENSNPCLKITRYRENKCERYLSTEELTRIGQALDAADATGEITLFASAALRLLLLTGARLNEILTLQWRFVDTERKLLMLPESKTGQKVIRLSDRAVKVLDSLPRLKGNPYVIAGNNEGTHIVNLQKPWRRVRALAGLDDVRIHDLRHSFASVAAASGASLPMIGALLGHSQPQTTARYAHFANDPLQKLNQDVGDAIAKAMEAKEG